MKKKLLISIIAVLILMVSSVLTANAEENKMIYDMSPVYDILSDSAKQSLENIGADSTNPAALSEISFGSIINEIVSLAGSAGQSPVRGLINITGSLLVCSIIYSCKNTLGNEISSIINTVSALCITCAVAIPALSVITSAGDVIITASNLMLAYIPILAVIMASTGHAVSGASYYSMMMAAGQGVGLVSSRVIIPLLNIFLGLSISSGVSNGVNLSGFISMISKAVKWILGFAMAIFSAVLAAKQLITTSVDDVSARAIRFTLNSFVPIVGSALSEAYKTVQGSVGLLKAGSGVFVIISVAIVFMPILLQCAMWILTLWLGKSIADALGLSQCSRLLDSISFVFSTLLAIQLCIMSIYIISTAIILMMGGGSS